MKRQPRRVKKSLVIDSESEKIFRLALASRVPRLKYHGIEPSSLTAVDIDIYRATGEKAPKGRVYEYKSTYFGKEE
jgi:hypothetical protein